MVNEECPEMRLPACQGVAPFIERRLEEFFQRQSTKDHLCGNAEF
jgi:hypothetical protein